MKIPRDLATITAVLLPDQAWHVVQDNSFSITTEGDWYVFLESLGDTVVKTCGPAESLLSFRCVTAAVSS